MHQAWLQRRASLFLIIGAGNAGNGRRQGDRQAKAIDENLVSVVVAPEGYFLPLFVKVTGATVCGTKRAGGNMVYVYEPEASLQKTGKEKT